LILVRAICYYLIIGIVAKTVLLYMRNSKIKYEFNKSQVLKINVSDVESEKSDKL